MGKKVYLQCNEGASMFVSSDNKVILRNHEIVELDETEVTAHMQAAVRGGHLKKVEEKDYKAYKSSLTAEETQMAKGVEMDEATKEKTKKALADANKVKVPEKQKDDKNNQQEQGDDKRAEGLSDDDWEELTAAEMKREILAAALIPDAEKLKSEAGDPLKGLKEADLTLIYRKYYKPAAEAAE